MIPKHSLLKSDLEEKDKKKRILIICQSSFSIQSSGLRQAIRATWASKDTWAHPFPVAVVFLLGNPQDETLQGELEIESEMYGDILQV